MDKQLSVAEITGKLVTMMIELTNHSSTKAVIEALSQQNIKLTQEQKDEIFITIQKSNAKHLEKNNPFESSNSD